jgi:hypothetical protein
VLGSPLIQPGGPVLKAMAGLTGTLSSIAQFANANPETVKYIVYAIGAIGAALIAIGGIALATLVGIPAAVSGIVVAVVALAALEWDKVRGYLLAFNQAVTDFIKNLAIIADSAKGLLKGFGIEPGGSGTSPGKTGKPWHPTSFDPGTNKIKAQPISLSLNVDGRTLAQSISEQLEYLYEHATGAPAYNGQSHFNRADGGIMGT